MNRKIRVLMVDDDALQRRLVPEQLASLGFETAAAASGEAALAALGTTDYDVVLLDIQMPGLSGLDALREIKKTSDAPEVIMLTADASLTSGIEAMRLGAYDYLTKPALLGEMEVVIRKADEKRRLLLQNASLRSAVREEERDERTPEISYRSAAMREVIAQAEAAARLDSTVLITGESGTGKDVIVRFIHSQSARRDAPLINVNCGALPESLFESEFFGHERGAFTGASAVRHGLIEAADGSTLFLDEIGDMPPPAQVKLLHFLEQGHFRRIGSTRDRTADVRIIAATNRELMEDVRQNRFRADLFYRLDVISLHIPPLRERREDISALAEHFLALYRQRFNRPALDLSTEARRQLKDYNWPGNVRELRNYLERAAALSTADIIEAKQVLPRAAQSPAATPEARHSATAGDAPPTIDELVRRHTLEVVAQAGGNRERAAALLGVSERKLYRMLREYKAAAS